MHQIPSNPRSIRSNMQEPLFLKGQLQLPATPVHLQKQVMAHIERALLRRMWIETLSALTITMIFTGYLLLSWSTIWLGIRESSFLQISRLFFSDPDILFSNIGDTLWSMVESIPVEPLLFTLILTLLITLTFGLLSRLREARHAISPHFI